MSYQVGRPFEGVDSLGTHQYIRLLPTPPRIRRIHPDPLVKLPGSEMVRSRLYGDEEAAVEVDRAPESLPTP